MFMLHEFMGADAGIEDVVYSDLTLALLKDTGWYDVDYSYGDDPIWGKGAGCKFFDMQCVIDGVPNSPEFCTDTTGTETCSFNRLNKARCNLTTFGSNLASEY
jgi:hypothetical protein